jgi:type II secretory pathway pseudopilin PulG
VKKPSRQGTRGFTIHELLLVGTLIALMAMGGVPRALLAFETGRVDEASAGLLSVWRGQRMYWLENRSFANQLRDLTDGSYIDEAILDASEPFTFSIAFANDTSFTVNAARSGGVTWSGTISVNELGVLSGTLSNGEGDAITPRDN